MHEKKIASVGCLTLVHDLFLEARSWLGTPWHHNASIKGVGVDCVHFLASCGKAVGIDCRIPIFYRQAPAEEVVLPQLREIPHLQELPLDRAKEYPPGTILCFDYAGVVHHVALVVPGGMIIHASRTNREVVEEPLPPELRRRLIAAFRVPLDRYS